MGRHGVIVDLNDKRFAVEMPIYVIEFRKSHLLSVSRPYLQCIRQSDLAMALCLSVGLLSCECLHLSSL